LVGSTLQPIDDLVVEESVNGSARARSFFPAVKHRLSLTHSMTSSELIALRQFYSDHRLDDSITVVWRPGCTDEETFECVFDGVPTYSDGNPEGTVTVHLREV